MPSNENTNSEMEHKTTEERHPIATALRKLHRKAPGTRVGMLQDWRQGSTSGKASRRETNALRDGR
jgi:hypothetical protein